MAQPRLLDYSTLPCRAVPATSAVAGLLTKRNRIFAEAARNCFESNAVMRFPCGFFGSTSICCALVPAESVRPIFSNMVESQVSHSRWAALRFDWIPGCIKKARGFPSKELRLCPLWSATTGETVTMTGDAYMGDGHRRNSQKDAIVIRYRDRAFAVQTRQSREARSQGPSR